MDEKALKILQDIAFSLERSASAAEATHKLYKQANEMTQRHMEHREEREREVNERQREDFSMAKERHEAFMRERKDRELALKRLTEGGKDGNIISVPTEKH